MRALPAAAQAGLRVALGNFRRKFWRFVLDRARRGLPPADVTEVLEAYWWDLVRLRMAEIARSDLGLGTVELLFVDNEGDAVDGALRDLRDQEREVRRDRAER